MVRYKKRGASMACYYYYGQYGVEVRFSTDAKIVLQVT